MFFQEIFFQKFIDPNTWCKISRNCILKEGKKCNNFTMNSKSKTILLLKNVLKNQFDTK